MLEKYPAFIQERLEKIKYTGGVDVVSDQFNTYVLIALGERRTGGYAIKIVDIIEGIINKQPSIIVRAKEIKPAPGQIVIQVITYPTEVYRLPLTTLPITVEWVRTG